MIKSFSLFFALAACAVLSSQFAAMAADTAKGSDGQGASDGTYIDAVTGADKSEGQKEHKKNKNKESRSLSREQSNESDEQNSAIKKTEKSSNALVPHPTMPGSVMLQTDPLAVYKEAGIDQEQERKIRFMAREFEDGQRVRLSLIGNLLKEMRDLQFEPDPDEKKVLAKQDEINRVQAEMGTERVKLVLKIRSIMSFDEKQRLVQNMRLSSRYARGGAEASK